ncbi:unnamed protein product [Mytilus coruscus]|uniref:Fibrinogen C-terminal domain-containing protein n=1 Tax=Mytilus coruscus TaxID=42192 RepID=A0A6J8A7G5_MYTCO|nr:unnamed protein product [Mytilus coruscus]
MMNCLFFACVMFDTIKHFIISGKSADQRTVDLHFLDHSYCIVHVPDFEAEIELGPGDEGKVPDDIDTTIFTATPLPVETTDSGSQTYHPTYSDSSTNVNLKTMRRQLFVLDVEKKPKVYTGLTLDVLKLVFSHVELKASRMKYWYGSSRVDDSFDDTENDVSGQKRGALRELKLWEEYLMSLVRPRKGLDTDVLADMLCRITWSSYKHTLKLLVGITPSGSFCFLSKLWSGAVSDRRITQASGFLEMLEFGDEIMADRGFTISDLLALKGATLAIPPFANGRQLSSRAVTRTRRIANARIHVERAIGDIKSFQLLQGTLPLTLKPILDDIIFVCGALCNLRSKLVKRKDGWFQFQRPWIDYENGFGNVDGKYWIGDSMAYQNGMKFSTIDQDNDLHSVADCAKIDGAWWHNHYCGASCLNRRFLSNLCWDDFSRKLAKRQL